MADFRYFFFWQKSAIVNIIAGITFTDIINEIKTKEMTADSRYRIRNFSKASLYVILYAVMMLLLLKLITNSKAMNNLTLEDKKKAEYLLNDERKIIPQ
jgi:hypothetical protein